MLHNSTISQKKEVMSLQDLISLISQKTGYQARKSGDGYVMRCPSHDDQNPSLSVSEGSDGTLLLKCHSGVCDFEQICHALNLDPQTLFPQKDDAQYRKYINYEYKDELGRMLYKKIRMEPGFDDKPKSFFCERIDESGNKVRNLKGCRRILYRLELVLKAIEDDKTIFLVEGEKDADNLFDKDLTATTAIISAEWDDEYTKILKNADVVLMYDNDKAGLKRRDLITRHLAGNVKKFRVVDLPGIEYKESHGEDISDWLAKGNSIELLQEIVNKTPEYKIMEKTTSLKAVSIEELFSLKLPEREMLLRPFLPSQGLVLIVAKRGGGKTHVALGIAYAVATGGTFLYWSAPVPKKVLYVDGEMPAVLMQERLKIIESMCEKKPEPNYLKLITPDLQDKTMPDLSLKEGRNMIEELVNHYDLIVLDNISCLFRSGNENDSESWQEAQEWALDLRRRGKSVVFVHHANKNGVQRGTSKKEDILDAVIILKHPDDYKSQEGARFDVIFDKSRHFTGEDAKPFQAHLIEESEGKYVWNLSDMPKDEEITQIAELKKQGLTIKEIESKTKLTKAKVEWRLRKAKEQGLL